MKNIIFVVFIFFFTGCLKTNYHNSVNKSTPLTKRRMDKVIKKYRDNYGMINLNPNDKTVFYNKISPKTVEELDSILNKYVIIMQNLKVNVNGIGKPVNLSRPVQ